MAEDEKVVGLTSHKDGIVELPRNYQSDGFSGSEEEEEAANAAVATVEDILGLSQNLPRDWVYLSALKRRVEVEAITDEERQMINKRAKKTFNKNTKRQEPDPDSVLHYLVMAKVITPKIPSVDMVAKMTAGDITRIVRAINRLSGLTSMDTDDALG